MFGDIVIDNGKYYVYILRIIDNYFKSNLLFIKNSPITLEEVNINKLEDYKLRYEELTTIVSSLRVDNVISKIINTNRANVQEKIKNNEILLNHELLAKGTYNLNENDVFSIRKFGKYKFIGIEKNTKKNNYVIKYLKYI